VGGPRPGRTAAAAGHRGGGGGGHAAPAPYRPDGARPASVPDAGGSAAGPGGDVGGTNQIPVPLEIAVWTTESATLRFRDPPLAGRAGRGGAPLVHQPHDDACRLGLVVEGLEQVGAAPLPQPPVLHPARIPVGDAPGVPHNEGPDSLLDGEGDHLLGGLVLGLMDATTMARLHAANPGAMAPPTPRPTLPALGCPPGCPGAAGLLVFEMQVALGPQRPPRHQQPRPLGHHRIGMDDAKVHPRHPAGIQIMLLDGDGGGDRQPQPPTLGQQRHRPDLLGRVGQGAGQPHPQLRLAFGDRQPHLPTLDGEGAVVEADRDQRALAPREAGVLLAGLAAGGGLEPGVAVAPQHRPRPHRGQLPEARGSGQLAAQRLVAGDWALALLVALPVGVQQPCPHVPGRAQQPVAAAGLAAGEPQPDRGRAVHQARDGGRGHSELMFDSRVLAVKNGSRCCGQPQWHAVVGFHAVRSQAPSPAEINPGTGQTFRQRH
jgi:hypothetical protein